MTSRDRSGTDGLPVARGMPGQVLTEFAEGNEIRWAKARLCGFLPIGFTSVSTQAERFQSARHGSCHAH